MVFATPHNSPPAIGLQKKTGTPVHYSRRLYGLECYGQGNEYSGIYQQRWCQSGRWTIKMKFYRPPPSRTSPQDVLRIKFANAVAGWQALTLAQKMVYYTRAVGINMSGYNIYLREFMLS